MQKDKLRKNNMEVPATSGTVSQTCVQRTRKWMLPVLLIILGLAIGLAQADDDAAATRQKPRRGQWTDPLARGNDAEKSRLLRSQPDFHQGARQRHLVEPGESEGLAKVVCQLIGRPDHRRKRAGSQDPV